MLILREVADARLVTMTRSETAAHVVPRFDEVHPESEPSGNSMHKNLRQIGELPAGGSKG